MTPSDDLQQGAGFEVELRDIDAVIPYASNPRQNAEAVDAVAASIREFGWRQPIVVDEEGTIIAGHTRFLAARRLGMKTVPVHVARGLSPTRARAYRLADNRTGENAKWDEQMLMVELAELDTAGFDLGLTGFQPEELAKLGGGDGAGDEGGEGGDDRPEPVGQYGVVVLCTDEEQQRAVFERLTGEGLTCRVVVT